MRVTPCVTTSAAVTCVTGVVDSRFAERMREPGDDDLTQAFLREGRRREAGSRHRAHDERATHGGRDLLLAYHCCVLPRTADPFARDRDANNARRAIESVVAKRPRNPQRRVASAFGRASPGSSPRGCRSTDDSGASQAACAGAVFAPTHGRRPHATKVRNGCARGVGTARHHGVSHVAGRRKLFRGVFNDGKRHAPVAGGRRGRRRGSAAAAARAARIRRDRSMRSTTRRPCRRRRGRSRPCGRTSCCSTSTCRAPRTSRPCAPYALPASSR